MKIVRVLLIIAGFALLFSVLGGSFVWHVAGFGTDLTIDGFASRVAKAPDTGAWSSYGGDPGGMRFVGASEITPANVSDLTQAWAYRTQALQGRDVAARRASFQATPIYVEDSLVLCTPFNEVVALAPDTGEQLWRFDAQVDINLSPANGFTCRGVSYWRDAERADQACSARVFMGTVDARLIALDAKTGERCRSFGVDGEVAIKPEMALEWPGEFQVTSAPAIAGDVVIVGSAISDNQRVSAPAGTVRAYDARTGAPLWSFDPIPRDASDPARASWGNDTSVSPGHANVWSTMSVDVDRGLVFLPTSSASPDFYGGLRPGDNRYTNSVVALEVATGKVVWDFQTVHHDVWDYDVPAQPGLYPVTQQDGRVVDVVAQATKTGLVFVLDRETGEPVLPVEERPVPQGGVEGEVLSPTQPFPVLTPPLISTRLTADDAFGLTYWDKRSCRERIAGARSEGLFTPPSLQGTILYPFTGGGANWGSAAFDPTRNLLIINMSNVAHLVTLMDQREPTGEEGRTHEAEYAPMTGAPYSMTRELLMSPLGLPCTPPPWGILGAVNLESGQIVWRRTLGSVRRFAGGLDVELGMPALGGPMVTATGLVFIGASVDDLIRAFDVATGDEMWRGELPSSGNATPMSYVHEGRQYVVIAAGGHKDTGLPVSDWVVAFALGAD